MKWSYKIPKSSASLIGIPTLLVFQSWIIHSPFMRFADSPDYRNGIFLAMWCIMICIISYRWIIQLSNTKTLIVDNETFTISNVIRNRIKIEQIVTTIASDYNNVIFYTGDEEVAIPKKVIPHDIQALIATRLQYD